VVVRGDGRAFEPGLATADCTRQHRVRGRRCRRLGSSVGRDDGCEDQKTRGTRIEGGHWSSGEGNRGLRSA
jgi:hypothetical protein